jgi:hypothetical protein
VRKSGHALTQMTPRDATRRRQARFRERQRDGRGVFRLELHHDQIVEALLVSRRLSEDAALRREMVERALANVITEWAHRWLAER